LEISSLAARYEGILANVKDATKKSGRSPESVLLVGVTKNVAADRLAEAYHLGIQDFGENRVQEWLPKAATLEKLSPRWHFIGHLQSNKVKKVVGACVLVHSVDSWHLAHALDEEARSRGLVQPVLLQVNITGEATKHGIIPADVPAVLGRIQQDLPGVQVQGFMTMAPHANDPEAARPTFRYLRELRDATSPALPHLSMGMSGDYTVAVEEGATLIRVGSALFGPRPESPE